MVFALDAHTHPTTQQPGSTFSAAAATTGVHQRVRLEFTTVGCFRAFRLCGAVFYAHGLFGRFGRFPAVIVSLLLITCRR